MKKLNKKYLVLLACVALLLTCSVGSTVAFLVDKADEVINTFTPTYLATDVKESFNGTSKSSIQIQNDGNIDAWVRVAIFGYWVDADGAIVAPWDQTAIDHDETYWTLEGGYYYYKDRLPPFDDPNTEVVEVDLTKNLLAKEITQPEDKPTGADHLVITVIHQSIQADGIANTAQAAFTAAATSIVQDGQ